MIPLSDIDGDDIDGDDDSDGDSDTDGYQLQW